MACGPGSRGRRARLLVALAVVGLPPRLGANDISSLHRMTSWDQSVYEHGIHLLAPAAHTVFFLDGTRPPTIPFKFQAIAPILSRLDSVTCEILFGYPRLVRGWAIAKGSLAAGRADFDVALHAATRGMCVLECYVSGNKTAGWAVLPFHISRQPTYVHQPLRGDGSDALDDDLIVFKPWLPTRPQVSLCCTARGHKGCATALASS